MYIASKIELGLPVHSIYLDLRKAFDKVQHVELLKKQKKSIMYCSEIC